jgi:hypothetical protein
MFPPRDIHFQNVDNHFKDCLLAFFYIRLFHLGTLAIRRKKVQREGQGLRSNESTCLYTLPRLAAEGGLPIFCCVISWKCAHLWIQCVVTVSVAVLRISSSWKGWRRSKRTRAGYSFHPGELLIKLEELLFLLHELRIISLDLKWSRVPLSYFWPERNLIFCSSRVGALNYFQS